MEFNKEELEDIIRKAFEYGQNWGETYSGWFTPTTEQIEEQIQEALKALGL